MPRPLPANSQRLSDGLSSRQGASTLDRKPDGRTARDSKVLLHPAAAEALRIERQDRRRLGALLVVVALLAVTEGLRLVQLQVLGHDKYVEIARSQRLRVTSVATPRGDFLDRAGKPLAISVPSGTVVANPQSIADKPEVARRLAEALALPYDLVLERISSDAKFAYVARQIDESVAQNVERLGIPGITVVEETRRFYPGRSLAANLLGFVGTDNQGLDGLEVGLEELVAGKPGVFEVEQDPLGRPIPQAEYRFEPPYPGADVVLTIDSEIQYRAEKFLAEAVEAYRAKGGSILVLEVGTGEILAMANVPTFDPNEFWKASPETRRNRLAVDVFEPGSTNKVITAAAALEEGKATLDERIGVPNRYRIADAVFKDAEDHPPLSWTVRDIVVHSSNIGTIRIAQRLGPQTLDRYLRAFGYGERAGIGIPGEASGILLPPDKWWSTSIGTIPIGQGIAVTGVQLAQVYATIANGGVRVPLKIVRGIVRDRSNPRLEEVQSQARPVRVVSNQTADAVADMLGGVVAEGTGKRAAVPGHQVAGKTGTARKPSESGGYVDKYVASFVGFAPLKHPRFVVAVVLDEPTPYYGGLSAAPLFSRIMGFVLAHEGVPPSGDQREFAKGSGPSSLEDAVVAGTPRNAASSQRGTAAQRQQPGADRAAAGDARPGTNAGSR